MAHNPWHLKGRVVARYHVQVELVEKATISHTPIHARVVAKVMRIFRGDHLMHVDSEVRFSVPVANAGDDRPYGELWMLLVKFRMAKYMEVFLEGAPPECGVSCGQIAVIHRLTDSPSMRVPSPEDLENLPLIRPATDLNTSNVI